MKNKSLKEALRELDRKNLDGLTHVPLEDMYYSPEYEKKIGRLLGKKKNCALSWKRVGKQMVAFALGAAFALGIVFLLPGGETPDESEKSPVWQYDVVDFVDTSYVVKTADVTMTAKKNGYQEGTYEYEYLTALSNLSFYTAIAESYVEASAAEYPEDSLIGGFLKIVSKDEIVAPYDDILLHAFEILDACGFAPAELTSDILFDYWWSLPYVKNRSTLAAYTGLSFADVHEKLTESANALLALDAKYPDYNGEFYISRYVCERAEALIKACEPVYENKIKHTEKWLAYYATIEATLTVEEEFIKELDAVKITISGNGFYRTPALASRLIENYTYDTVVNTSGYTQQNQLRAKTVTVYMPVYTYYGHFAANKELYIEKSTEDGSHYDNVYYTPALDPAEYYSDEPIAMNNKALDIVLRGYFGGDYSERDLLGIQGVLIQYFEYEGYPSKPFEVMIDVWDGTRVRTLKCELDVAGAESEGDFIEALAEDLSHFHGLCYFKTNGDADRFVSDELATELNPYYVNPDDAR